jgi:SpoVK/Ycf46/Vps4 family AAA+-type ATPase
VDLPGQAERKPIFAIQLSKRKRNPADFGLDQAAAAARGYSGAEIESVVETALYAAYSRKQPLTTHHLLEAIRTTVPLSTTRAEEIEALREWAGKRAVPASSADGRAGNA